jgi:MMPL family
VPCLPPKALAEQIRPLARDLALITARERALEGRIQHSQNRPRRQARLRNRLQRVEAREARVRQELAPLKRQARELAAKERRLQEQAAQLQQQANRLQRQADDLKAQKKALQQQGAELQTQGNQLQVKADRLKKQGAALQRKGDALQQQADKLQKQGNALQRQADALQKQANQLKAAQKQAEQQQKQAEKLKKQLTAMLTQAGGDDRGTDPRVVNLQNGLSATSGVVDLTPPQINKKGDVVLVSAVPSTAPASVPTADLVDKVRATVLPDTNKGEGITSYVGGFTASYVDLATLISARLLLVIGTVVLLGALLLLVAFRSLLIPLQAAVTNLLSAAAAFGVLVAAFQWGWGISLLGIETSDPSVPIASYVPLMMFAALFGLSMDYEVFLVSHVQQHHHGGEEARDAVSSALMSSAKITTAAALIMASVFASFIANGDPTIKQFGVGLSVAVLLAGILVATLAPAALTLFGRAAWWLPSWLDRFLPHISVEGETPPPTPPTPPPPPKRPRPTIGGGPTPVLPVTPPGPVHPARHRDL